MVETEPGERITATVREFAEYVTVSPKTVWKWISNRESPKSTVLSCEPEAERSNLTCASSRGYPRRRTGLWGSPATRLCSLSKASGGEVFRRQWCAEDRQSLGRRTECSDPAFEAKPGCSAFVSMAREIPQGRIGWRPAMRWGDPALPAVGDPSQSRSGANLVPVHARQRPAEIRRPTPEVAGRMPFFPGSAGMRYAHAMMNACSEMEHGRSRASFHWPLDLKARRRNLKESGEIELFTDLCAGDRATLDVAEACLIVQYIAIYASISDAQDRQHLSYRRRAARSSPEGQGTRRHSAIRTGTSSTKDVARVERRQAEAAGPKEVADRRRRMQ
jgi:hypothetical protein